MADTVVAGGSGVADASKGIEALKKLREEGQEWASLLGETRSDIVQAYEDFRTYLRGGRGVSASNTVIMYRDTGGRGKNRGFNTGDAINAFSDIHWQVHALRWKDWNDEPSSLKVEGGVALLCYEHSAYGGDRLIVIGPSYIPDLGVYGWNDRISSCKVLPADPEVIARAFP